MYGLRAETLGVLIYHVATTLLLARFWHKRAIYCFQMSILLLLFRTAIESCISNCSIPAQTSNNWPFSCPCIAMQYPG
jgi:hypothetical protein